jgi:hypothetical protein
MAISQAGTFDYTGVIPGDGQPSAGRWPLRDRSDESPSAGRDPLTQDRLVGLRPSLEIVDAGVTPEVRVSPYTGIVRPKVSLSRLILRADDTIRATVAGFSFCVDRALTRSWRAGDVLHVSRTSCGGLGLSVVRGDRLLVAIGAVTSVPQGGLVDIRTPWDVVREAEAVFRRLDPRFVFHELPLAVRVGSETCVMYRGRPRMSGYEEFIEHGFYTGTPGTSECAALALIGGCPDTAAISSAQLLEYPDLSDLLRW